MLNILDKDPYSGEKGARLYYEVLTHDSKKPNACEKWESKLNKDNYQLYFKKLHRIREIKLKWYQIRVVHRILATNVNCFDAFGCPG